MALAPLPFLSGVVDANLPCASLFSHEYFKRTIAPVRFNLGIRRLHVRLPLASCMISICFLSRVLLWMHF
jgi:hypothetical protein